MKFGIASDHGGFSLKTTLQKEMPALNLIDFGTTTHDRVDYPVFADQLCMAIATKDIDAGILICGTGIGISIRANRYHGIRAALVHDVFTAKMAKAHNNANVLCLGGRTTDPDTAIALINEWITTDFEGGRHTQRLAKIDAPLPNYSSDNIR
jgi:ribose 5-phosphate isomerase B